MVAVVSGVPMGAPVVVQDVDVNGVRSRSMWVSWRAMTMEQCWWSVVLGRILL